MKTKFYDVVIVGAGHAGVESALASARLGIKTLLITMNLEAISFMACNPSIGGTAKGHLVREIDALGGEMGLNADQTLIQLKMLNSGKGPAVQSLRAQSDKNFYHRRMKAVLEREENLSILQAEVKKVLVEDKKVVGVETTFGEIGAKAVVLATGVYLDARVIIGENVRDEGPAGFMRAHGLTQNLIDLGIPIRRFKTGTPPRVLGKTIDYSKTEIAEGDTDIYSFSTMSDLDLSGQRPCYLTYTNEKTHKLILDNLDRAPLYNGVIEGTGPRYCPSIEVKIMRFKDKERHQLFLEPEGADTDEVYVQGLSTSLPADIQEEMVHSIKGLENAEIMRYAYAIEYDCIDPLSLTPALAIKGYEGLFSAGQINGSSGYEEAGAQGLIAGINAARYIKGESEFVLQREESYIGVLIDDLVTKGTLEPYRMMTSRAEYRLSLRQDNADIRLTDKGIELGLVKEDRKQRFLERKREIEELFALTKKSVKLDDTLRALCDKCNSTYPKTAIPLIELLKRPEITREAFCEFYDNFSSFKKENVEYLFTELKYEGYIAKEKSEIEKKKKLEKTVLPSDIDYNEIKGLRVEAAEKLNLIKPRNLGQASRISGVSPADITVLLLKIKSEKNG
ncbi:MAG: tRNA uridine-5-carboxymethylaminomethyl(34) synthesis enzyme MnmG [Clostridia bacterium]|nr:tRNA uridine-5-carboxymethylaminomethyl(34) synthesis enzyme MnmG [Clostridia bacterium]